MMKKNYFSALLGFMFHDKIETKNKTDLFYSNKTPRRREEWHFHF